MRTTGHVLIGSDGQLIAVDGGFCEVMHVSAAELEGRLVLDVTAPADRAECSCAIERLRRTHQPFQITKRFLRDDGSLVWVRNTVSITADGGLPDLIVATIEPVPENNERAPATLLDCARFLMTLHQERDSVCDPHLLSDVAWSTLLSIYIAEAEGRALDVDAVAAILDKPVAVVGRWVRALIHHDVIELETRQPTAKGPKMYRLTAATHRRLETYLARLKPRWTRLMMAA